MKELNPKQTVIAFGGVSGYVNTEVELKTGPSGVKYVSLLLGRGKDDRGNSLASYSLALFGKDAELFAATISKGDLIRFTQVALNPVVEEGKTIAQNFKMVGKDWVKIGQNSNQEQAQRPAQQPAQQAAQQPADSFDDDIPF